MIARRVALLVSILSTLAADCYQYAIATTPLVAPLDSTCLRNALTQRLGPPRMQSVVDKRTRTAPAALWLYFGDASYTLTYDDSLVTLRATQIVGSGVFSRAAARQDSVGRLLGIQLLAVRDSCGGRAVPGLPELTYGW